MPASIPQRNTEMIWIWGLTLNDKVSFLGNIFALIISIVCTFVISICAIKIVSTAIKSRNRDKSVEFVERLWLIMGLIIIVIMVIWIFSIHYLITYTVTATEKEGSLRTTTTTTYRFWAYNTIGFGVIGVILGGCLSIIGACIKGLNLPKEV